VRHRRGTGGLYLAYEPHSRMRAPRSSSGSHPSEELVSLPAQESLPHTNPLRTRDRATPAGLCGLSNPCQR
jgi:hypothetical protein